MPSALNLASKEAAARKRHEKAAKAERARRNLQGTGESDKKFWGDVPGAYERQFLGINIRPGSVDAVLQKRCRSHELPRATAR